jgi:membrane protein insertase Oxa1/YidC/SpoIIIJ
VVTSFTQHRHRASGFPSGLVLYWAWNNILSLLQQYAIMRKNNTEVHLWKNLGVEKLFNGGISASSFSLERFKKPAAKPVEDASKAAKDRS